jgi:hypothetical protein
MLKPPDLRRHQDSTIALDEAGGNDAAGIVRYRSVRGQSTPYAVIRTGGFDRPVAADDEPIRLMPEGAGGIHEEGIVGKETSVPRSAVTVASGMVRSLARPVGRQIVFLRPFA